MEHSGAWPPSKIFSAHQYQGSSHWLHQGNSLSTEKQDNVMDHSRVCRVSVHAPSLIETIHQLVSCLKVQYCRISYSLAHRGNYTLVQSTCETAPKSLFWAPPIFQELSTCHDYNNWPVKQAIVDSPIRMKGNSERPFW